MSGPRRLGGVAPLAENMAESTTACLVTMVQGNVLVLGLGHWVIASQTGVLAGVVATVAVWMSGSRGRWGRAGVLAVTTALIDAWVHPGGFGPVGLEAALTGVGAGVLSLLVGRLGDLRRARRARSRAAGPVG